jgi:hypothetical protein
MVTYERIQQYVHAKSGHRVKKCWIAHVKEICGLPVKPSPNRLFAGKRTNPCPPNRIEEIKQAFHDLGMI